MKKSDILFSVISPSRQYFVISLAIMSTVLCSCTSTASQRPASAKVSYIPARPISNAGPFYPELAFENGETAEIDITVNIDVHGAPHDCRILHSTNHHFDQSALEFCGRTYYQPAKKNGLPTNEYNHPFPVKYKLS